jgi:peptide/nickel transport system ATP-binding protein
VTDAAAPTAVPVLQALNLSKHFPVRRSVTEPVGRRRVVHSVNGVSLAFQPGSATALVGESGSGKSTLARMLAQHHRATSGEVLLNGSPVNVRSRREFRRFARSVQLVLQDPYASLNPHNTIGYHLARPLLIHGHAKRSGKSGDLASKICELLEDVGLAPGRDFSAKFPHELSGGQRQRVAIARALAVSPQVLIADEPVSMLDVSLRVGILELLRNLQQTRGLTILYVTHDLPTARYFAETIAVMYAGEIVECGPAEEVVNSPAHPYTRLLLAATPDPGRLRSERLEAQGEPPSPIDLPPGCPFHERCPHAFEKCFTSAPPRANVATAHWARCWLYDEEGDENTGDRSETSSRGLSGNHVAGESAPLHRKRNRKGTGESP